MHKTAFAVVCDGMGGLQQGELASATVVRAYEKWYEEELPELLEQSHTEKVFANTLEDTWSRIDVYKRQMHSEFRGIASIMSGISSASNPNS